MAALAFSAFDLIDSGVSKVSADGAMAILENEYNVDVPTRSEVEEVLRKVGPLLGRQSATAVALRLVEGEADHDDEWRRIVLVYFPPRRRGGKVIGYRPEQHTFVWEEPLA